MSQRNPVVFADAGSTPIRALACAPKPGLPDRPPEEEAKAMAGASSGLFHRASGPGSRENRPTFGTTAIAAPFEPTSLGDEWGGKAADFIGVFGKALLHGAQSQFETYLTDLPRLPDTLPSASVQSQMQPVAAFGIIHNRGPVGQIPTSCRWIPSFKNNWGCSDLSRRLSPSGIQAAICGSPG
jgi:hypothetical protein